MALGRASLSVAALFGAWAGPALAGGQAPASAPMGSARIHAEGEYPARDVTFSNGVAGIPGVVYAEVAGYRPLRLDLYLPPGSASRPPTGFPLILYVHGGGWFGGDTRHSAAFPDFPDILASLAARGYVVASVEYRLSGEATFPAQIQDVRTALRWLRSHAPDFGGDPARAATWGVSAGGHLAALAAVGCDVAALGPPVTEQPAADPGLRTGGPSRLSDCVQGSVAWYGVFDLSTIAAQARQDHARPRDNPDDSTWRLLGCFAGGCRDGRIAAASPVAYVDRSDPPMLLIAGADDRTVPYHQTLEMADALRAAGVPTELVVLPGVDHNLKGRTPEATREARLKALAATFRFFDRTVGNSVSPREPP